MSNTPKTDVPVGIGTKVGLGLGVPLTLVGAVTAFILGDRSDETVGVIVAAVLGGGLLAVTIGGRMLQAALRARGRDDLADELDELDDRAVQAEERSLAALERVDSAHQRINQVVAKVAPPYEGPDRRHHNEEGQDGEAPSPILFSGGAFVYGNTRGPHVGTLPIDPDDELVDEDDDDVDKVEADYPDPERMVPSGPRAVDEPPVPDEGDPDAPAGDSHRGDLAAIGATDAPAAVAASEETTR